MFAYKTNNPQYLEYVARYMTRDEIKADPVLCQWLESPFVKDNMELAIRFNEAEDGDFQNKKDFVEYYLCNGPELDADTLLYYRSKILTDNTYREIAYTYYSDLDVVDDIRASTYGKTNTYTDSNGNTWKDCFKQPCDYLGPFSLRQGHFADAGVNSANPNNVLGEAANRDRLKGSSQYTSGPTTSGASTSEPDALLTTPSTTDGAASEVKRGFWPKWADNLINPKQFFMHVQHATNRDKQTKTLAEKLKSANKLGKVQTGDPYAIIMGESWSLAQKAHLRRQMGDCYRLWKQCRDFNPYDPSKNLFRPISAGECVNNTTPSGQPVAKKDVPVRSGPPSAKSDNLFNTGQFREYLKEKNVSVDSEQYSDIKSYIEKFKKSKVKTTSDRDTLQCVAAVYYISKNAKQGSDYNYKEKFENFVSAINADKSVDECLKQL